MEQFFWKWIVLFCRFGHPSLDLPHFRPVSCEPSSFFVKKENTSQLYKKPLRFKSRQRKGHHITHNEEDSDTLVADHTIRGAQWTSRRRIESYLWTNLPFSVTPTPECNHPKSQWPGLLHYVWHRESWRGSHDLVSLVHVHQSRQRKTEQSNTPQKPKGRKEMKKRMNMRLLKNGESWHDLE